MKRPKPQTGAIVLKFPNRLQAIRVDRTLTEGTREQVRLELAYRTLTALEGIEGVDLFSNDSVELVERALDEYARHHHGSGPARRH